MIGTKDYDNINLFFQKIVSLLLNKKSQEVVDLYVYYFLSYEQLKPSAGVICTYCVVTSHLQKKMTLKS